MATKFVQDQKIDDSKFWEFWKPGICMHTSLSDLLNMSGLQRAVLKTFHHLFYPMEWSTCREFFRLKTAYNLSPGISIAVIMCWGRFDSNFAFLVL